MDCLFCKIIEKKVPADIVFENKDLIVFKDIKPKAPVHLLIVPKKHIASINDISIEEKDLVGEIFLTAQRIAQENNIKNSGYKLTVNVGEGAGQEIEHLHIHLIGGWNN